MEVSWTLNAGPGWLTAESGVRALAPEPFLALAARSSELPVELDGEGCLLGWAPG